MFKNLPESDVTTTKYESKKKWRLSDGTEGVSFHAGTKLDETFSPEDSPKNSNGTYTRTIYEVIRHKYYRKNGNPYEKFGISNIKKTDLSGFPRGERSSIYVLKISSQLFGNQIDPGSFHIETRPEDQRTLSATDDGHGNLISERTEDQIGNVFYPHGIAVLTSPPSSAFDLDQSDVDEIIEEDEDLENPFPFDEDQNRYTAFPDYEKGLYDLLFQKFNLEFSSVVTNYENEVAARIEPYEFGATTNPTARKEEGVPIEEFEDGRFRPYVTSVGFYNDKKELIATAKLSKPIKLPESTPMTILARIDT